MAFAAQMLTIRSIFLYLDRTYVISTMGVRSLFDMGLQLFRNHLAAHPAVQSTTVTGLLQLIESERKVSCPLFQPAYLSSLRLAFCPPTGILPRPVFDLSSSMFGS